jgi:hypothetical protein
MPTNKADPVLVVLDIQPVVLTLKKFKEAQCHEVSEASTDKQSTLHPHEINYTKHINKLRTVQLHN